MGVHPFHIFLYGAATSVRHVAIQAGVLQSRIIKFVAMSFALREGIPVVVRRFHTT